MADNMPDGTSPRTFALNHLRPRSSFKGCSRIADYELQGKLGEGTFGYDHLNITPLRNPHGPTSRHADIAFAVRFIVPGLARLAPSSL